MPSLHVAILCTEAKDKLLTVLTWRRRPRDGQLPLVKGTVDRRLERALPHPQGRQKLKTCDPTKGQTKNVSFSRHYNAVTLQNAYALGNMYTIIIIEIKMRHQYNDACVQKISLNY